MPYYFIILGLVVLLLALPVWYLRESRRTRMEALRLLDALDSEYEDFMHKRLTLAFLQEESWETERSALIAEALEALKPTLDTLSALISSSRNVSVQLPLDSPIFKNIAGLAEASFGRNLPPNGISGLQEQLYAAFTDAAKADLKLRWLDFQTGERLQP